MRLPEDFKGWKLWDPSANGGCSSVIVLHHIVWNKGKFPGMLCVALDVIPEHFDRPAEPGDTESSPDEEEVFDSPDSEGVAIPLPLEPAVPPSDFNSSLSNSRSSSTASPSPSPLRTPPCPAVAPALPCTLPQAAAPGPPSAPRPAMHIASRPAPPNTLCRRHQGQHHQPQCARPCALLPCQCT
jgi:hypothetical protein